MEYKCIFYVRILLKIKKKVNYMLKIRQIAQVKKHNFGASENARCEMKKIVGQSE